MLVYGGYKNLFGHTQLIERNMYIYPDHTSPFDGRHPDGTDSWAGFVASQWAGPDEPDLQAADELRDRTRSSDAPYCALSAEACAYNATLKQQLDCDDSGYGLVYRNNSCIFNGGGTTGGGFVPGQTKPAAFWYSACQISNLSYPATMATSDNKYFTDLVNSSHELVITCGDDAIPLPLWQSRYGQDRGSSVQPAMSAGEIVAAAKRKLGLLASAAEIE